MKKLKCSCPIYCRFCGAKRRRDWMGHYCPTKNCQWHHGYSICTLHKDDKAGGQGGEVMPTLDEQANDYAITHGYFTSIHSNPVLREQDIIKHAYLAGAAAKEKEVLAIIATATRALIAVPDTGDYIKGVFALQEVITRRIQRGEEGN